MRHRSPNCLTIALSALAVVVSLPLSAQSQYSQNEELSWRTQHAADLLKPDGWLSLIGLEWLAPGDTSIGAGQDNKIRLPNSVPAHVAVLKLEDGVVTLLPPREGFPEGLQVAGLPAKEQILHADQDKDKSNPRLTIGALTFYVIKRADKFALRIKDAKSRSILNFHGLKWFDPDPNYHVIAKWTPYIPAKSVMLATLIGTSYSQPIPGYAEFSLQGKVYRLEPVLEDPKSSKLFFILKDSTSADSTYPACRFLYASLPDHGLDQPGELVLDFNHLENPPCAYTSYATCPLPPAGNRLPIALPVGERRYHK